MVACTPIWFKKLKSFEAYTFINYKNLELRNTTAVDLLGKRHFLKQRLSLFEH